VKGFFGSVQYFIGRKMIFYFQFFALLEMESKSIVLAEWRNQFDFEYVMRRKNKKNRVRKNTEEQ